MKRSAACTLLLPEGAMRVDFTSARGFGAAAVGMGARVRSMALLALSAFCGCGIHAGYVANDAARTWPDSYYYGALRADARQWQAVRDSDASLPARTAKESVILADLPLSIIADTATLPVLIGTSAAQAISGAGDAPAEGDGGESIRSDGSPP
jgi:uncharacterized protein YceK